MKKSLGIANILGGPDLNSGCRPQPVPGTVIQRKKIHQMGTVPVKTQNLEYW
jgi:hypothetical protein